MRQLLFPVLLLLCSNSSAEVIKKWVDDQGNVYYGDTPPYSVKTEEIRVSPKPSNPGRSLPRLNTDRDNTSASQSQPSSSRALPDDQARSICDDARKTMNTLNRSSRIRLQMSDGGSRFMSKEEIEQRRQQTQQDIDQYCR